VQLAVQLSTQLSFIDLLLVVFVVVVVVVVIVVDWFVSRLWLLVNLPLFD